MIKVTPLHDLHIEAGGRMVDFAGWDMPLHYGSQLKEHRLVRADAGMFDVSHMTIIDVSGNQAEDFLRFLLANDVARLKEGQALYSCMLNDQGGILDDLIVYAGIGGGYRVVVNAGTRDKDIEWITRQGQRFDVRIDERSELAMIAVQGPNAREQVHTVLEAEERRIAEGLSPFYGAQAASLFVARTGYTGEDGYELMVTAERARDLWQALAAHGVAPIGLGARDTLRLEAGMALYGVDMDESTSPLESGLAWTVAWKPDNRDFIGRSAISDQRDNEKIHRATGLLLEGKGVLRHGQPVCLQDGTEVGILTSGAFSPTLGKGVALARLDGSVTAGLCVSIRDRLHEVTRVKAPFVRNGKPCYKVL